MAKRIFELMGEVGSILNALPGVFSTVQWGGRAYKLPGRNGSTKKPRLLAFVTMTKEEDAINVVFKLPGERSTHAKERFAWVGPFEFGKWEKSGWISARITQKRQLSPLKKMLAECHAMFPVPEIVSESASPTSSSNPVVSRLNRVMAEARADGWEPEQGH